MTHGLCNEAHNAGKRRARKITPTALFSKYTDCAWVRSRSKYISIFAHIYIYLSSMTLEAVEMFVGGGQSAHINYFRPV